MSSNAARVDDDPAIRLRDLTVSYRGHPAVHHLSGAFGAATLTAVVGPNGAGKSSLLGALGGTIRHFEGRIERDPALRVAYLPQASTLDRSFPMRVHEVVAMGLWSRIGSFGALRAADRSGIDEALAAVGLSGFEHRWLGELSAGQAQRVLFARVLMQDAGLILLDEPFSAIDARTTADLLGLLQRWKHEARTVIAVLHDLEQVREHFEQVLLLARERVAWGPTAEVLKAEHLFKARQMAEAWDESAPACRVPA
ncbi:MAG: metal ABC transporter ATP-binding protein [Burkholderiales bacterium]|nr:metal ABC transporter ATP-binding protein [Burkholderiales bacterium]